MKSPRAPRARKPRRRNGGTSYIKYLNDWADDHSGAECYGAAPLGFDEWLEEEYDWSKEDEGDDE